MKTDPSAQIWREKWRITDKALEDINALMWESFMVNGREFGREQGAQIMAILNEWCEKEEAIFDNTIKRTDKLDEEIKKKPGHH